MMFIYRPQTPSRVVNARSQSPVQRAYHNYDPDEAFLEFKRREYIAALEEAEQRTQFQRELDAEEERHRRALQHIAAQETVRRQHAVNLMEQLAQQSQQADELRQAQRAQRALQERQAQAVEAQQAHLQPHAQRLPRPGQPSPQEILRRRLERQKEEESRSREFHRRILSDIFGVPVEISESQTPVQRPTELPKEVQPQQQAYEPEQPEKEEEPHWSLAPLRNRALAEIAAVNRAFISLKNTFIFPTGQLERVPDSMPPKLAYNSTNAAIHAYKHALIDLLSKLDGIESHGFKGIRMTRKQLVVKIEEEMLALEKKIAENLTPASSTAAPAAPAARDVEMAEPAAEAPSHTPNPAGYDAEVEDIFVAPTPKTNTDTTTVTTAEQEPIPLINVPEVPSQEYAVSDSDIQMVAVPIASTEQADSSAAALPTAIPAKHTPTISVSDEEDEDEVDDAVHFITSEDGTKAKAGQEGGHLLLL